MTTHVFGMPHTTAACPVLVVKEPAVGPGRDARRVML